MLPNYFVLLPRRVQCCFPNYVHICLRHFGLTIESLQPYLKGDFKFPRKEYYKHLLLYILLTGDYSSSVNNTCGVASIVYDHVVNGSLSEFF